MKRAHFVPPLWVPSVEPSLGPVKRLLLRSTIAGSGPLQRVVAASDSLSSPTVVIMCLVARASQVP